MFLRCIPLPNWLAILSTMSPRPRARRMTELWTQESITDSLTKATSTHAIPTTTPHNLPTAPNGIDPVGNGGGYTDQANQAFQLNEVYTLNPSTIVVIQASYTRWAL